MAYLLRSASLANYVEVARSVGLNPYQQLSDAGLGAHSLLNSEVMLPAEAVSNLLEASARASGYVDFGLRMADSRQQSELGPLALALREVSTLRKAIGRLARYSKLHNEALAIHVEESGDFLTIRAELMGRIPGTLRQSIELVVGVLHRTIHSFLGQQLGSAPTPRGICFTHAAPARTASHVRIFWMQASFNQEFDGIVYRTADLDVPFSSHDPAMAQQVRCYLDTMLAQTTYRLPDKVRRLVSSMLPQGACSIDRVAQFLGVDRRTVHRRLSRSGESYSKILNAVRAELTTRYIENCERPLSDVAALVGFSSLSAFSRWFSREYGCSVSEWRVRRMQSANGTQDRWEAK